VQASERGSGSGGLANFRPSPASCLGFEQQGPIELHAIAGAQRPIRGHPRAEHAHGHKPQVKAIKGGVAGRLAQNRLDGGPGIDLERDERLPLGGRVGYFNSHAPPNSAWAR